MTVTAGFRAGTFCKQVVVLNSTSPLFNALMHGEVVEYAVGYPPTSALSSSPTELRMAVRLRVPDEASLQDAREAVRVAARACGMVATLKKKRRAR
jgi:hypothetical protein